MTGKSDEEFRSRLEWQLRSEFRRQAEFPLTGSRLFRFRKFLVPIFGLFVGFAVATAAQHYQESGRKELLLAQARAAVELTQAQVELTAESLEEMREEASDDSRLYEALVFAEWEQSQIERELRRAKLNLEETQKTGLPPQDKLTDPLVYDEDYVSERLLLDLESARERVVAIELGIERYRFEQHSDQDEIQIQYLQMGLQEEENQEKEVLDKLELRKGFLEGRISAKEIAIRTELVAAEKKLVTARSQREAMETQLELMLKENEAGKLPDLQLKHMRFELTKIEWDEELARLEYEFLKRKLF